MKRYLLIALILAGCTRGKESESWPHRETDDLLAIANTAFPLRCGKCVGEGRKSVVAVGVCKRTYLDTVRWYDENGNRYYEDMNTVTCNHTCSNGHWFETSRKVWPQSRPVPTPDTGER